MLQKPPCDIAILMKFQYEFILMKDSLHIILKHCIYLTHEQLHIVT